MKAKCTVCDHPFDQTRSDQQFCSKACKQKRFREKKAESSDQQPVKQMTFRISEYREFMEEYRWDRELFPFVMFCFYRRLVPTGLSGDAVYDALNDLISGLDSELMKEKPFLEFRVKFLSHEFEIVK